MGKAKGLSKTVKATAKDGSFRMRKISISEGTTRLDVIATTMLKAKR